MSNAIEFENVSKQYRLGLVGTGTLAHDLRRFWVTNVLRQEDPYLKIGETNDRSQKGTSDYVWALKDINFQVEQGDVVGIIGKNGAGKSTLLKLLSRVTGPTTGTIRAHGRIGSLLEVGTGFHPEMTGRENIFMNGAILGMSRREIQAKLDEIIDFSGCERYIDTPVKRYSSGMMVRLGFAVAAHLDPEILVVDEVLAVGDAEFQKKAIGKMQDVSKGEGRTVLFVSHNMQSVAQLCKHGVMLDKGQIAFNGDVNECINYYYSMVERGDRMDFDVTRDVEYLSKGVQVHDILINGKKPEMLLITPDLGPDVNRVTVDIRFTLKKHQDIYLVAQLLDGSNMVSSYSSQSGAGRIHRFDAGEHIIHEDFIIPSNLVNGEFYLTIKLNDANGAFLIQASRIIQINKQKYVSRYTGNAFDKSNSGYFVIDDATL